MSKMPSPSFVPGIIWLIVSTILLTMPGSSLPDESWMGNLHLDKVVHIGMFGIMTYLWCWGCLKYHFTYKDLKTYFFIIAAICLVYGLGMEFVQKHLVVNRSFDSGDVWADAAGCILGLAIAKWKLLKKN